MFQLIIPANILESSKISNTCGDIVFHDRSENIRVYDSAYQNINLFCELSHAILWYGTKANNRYRGRRNFRESEKIQQGKVTHLIAAGNKFLQCLDSFWYPFSAQLY